MASISLSSNTDNLNSENNYTASLTVSGTGFSAYTTYYVGLYSGTTLGGEYSVTTDGSGNLNLIISVYPALFPDICRSNSQITVRVNVGGYNYPATKAFTLTADLTISDVYLNGDLQGNSKTFIAGVTNVSLGFTLKTLQYALLNSVTATYNGNQISLRTTGESFNGEIDASSLTVGSMVVQITATDTRGTQVSYTIEAEVFAHDAPKSTAQIFRCDENGIRSAAGEYLSITVWANSTPVAIPIYTISVVYIEEEGVLTRTNIPLSNGVTKVIGASEYRTIDPDKNYRVILSVIDSFGYGTNPTFNIPKVVRIFNVKDGGTGAAFGKLAETDNLLDSAWDINTDGEYLVNGDPLIDTFPDASLTQRGLMSTGAQSFAGNKTFNEAIILGGTTADTALFRFSRTSYNYLVVPNGGSLNIAFGSNSTANDSLRVTETSVDSFKSGAIDLGTSAYPWKELYANKANIGGSENVGSSAIPIYWNNGVPTEVASSAAGVAAAIGAYGYSQRATPTSFDDITLVGTYFAQGSAVTGLPTTSGYYYVMCFGRVQIAVTYSNSGASKLWVRYYTNNQWYAWKGVALS